MTETLRQVIHDHMAQIAARHAAGLYRHLDGDTAAQLFAQLADTALAYLMEAEAELADPGPGQSLAAACGLSAKQALLTGLAENLDLKNGDPGSVPGSGWLAWRAANGQEGTPATQPGRQTAEAPAPVIARAEEPGRDAGQAAASRVFDGNTPEEAYRQVLRGIEDGDPAVLDAIEPPAIGPAAGYGQDDLARDLGIEPGDPALPRAVSAYADAFTGSFWQDTERAPASTPASARARPGPLITRPGRTPHRATGKPYRKEHGSKDIRRAVNLAKCPGKETRESSPSVRQASRGQV